MQTFLMNGKERDRPAMFRRVEQKQLTLEQAAALSISYRQAKRLKRSYRQHGDAGLVHGLRGSPSNNQSTVDARRELGIALYREHYGASV